MSEDLTTEAKHGGSETGMNNGLGRWRGAFPDFNPEDIPSDLPDGFVDVSWKNETMPHFLHPASGIELWVNYAKPEDREIKGSTRYLVTKEEDEHATALYSGDDWPATRAYLVARIELAEFANDDKGSAADALNAVLDVATAISAAPGGGKSHNLGGFAEALSRPVILHVCKDRTVTYRRRGEPVFNDVAIPVFSVDTTDEADRLIVALCKRQHAEHPLLPGKPWYRVFVGDDTREALEISDLWAITEAFRATHARLSN